MPESKIKPRFSQDENCLYRCRRRFARRFLLPEFRTRP
jgi:hypothetical protein